MTDTPSPWRDSRYAHPYEMSYQLQKGEAAEAQLDCHFATRFQITQATRAQQRQGIDRVFTKHATGDSYTIEYKTDWTAGRTGNAFVETVSVDTEEIPGWAYTSQAEWLAYFVPDRSTVYLLQFTQLRQQLPHWLGICKVAPPIPNQGYNTLGILVPLAEFAQIADKIETIDEFNKSRYTDR